MHTCCAWKKNPEEMVAIIVTAELVGLLERTNAGLLHSLLSGKTGKIHQSTRNAPKGEHTMSALTTAGSQMTAVLMTRV